MRNEVDLRHVFEIPAAPTTCPWELTRDELQGVAFFHGTTETIEGALRGGAYDDVLWTVREPAIAQTYMPPSGGAAMYAAPRGEYELREPVAVRGSGVVLDLAKLMGYELEVLSEDRMGPTSWRWWKDGESVFGPLQSEILDFVRNELGYDVSVGGTVWINTRSRPDGTVEYLHSSYKEPGQLFVLLPNRPLKCYDWAQDRDPDLTELDYHRVDLFRKLDELGFDVVRIWDFAQSPVAGNVPHISFGFLSKGLEAVSVYSMPAVHHDWGSDLHRLETDDFITGHRDWVEEALRRGERVPPKVLTLYPDLAEQYDSPTSALEARVAGLLEHASTREAIDVTEPSRRQSAPYR